MNLNWSEFQIWFLPLAFENSFWYQNCYLVLIIRVEFCFNYNFEEGTYNGKFLAK